VIYKEAERMKRSQINYRIQAERDATYSTLLDVSASKYADSRKLDKNPETRGYLVLESAKAVMKASFSIPVPLLRKDGNIRKELAGVAMSRYVEAAMLFKEAIARESSAAKKEMLGERALAAANRALKAALIKGIEMEGDDFENLIKWRYELGVHMKAAMMPARR
jgi:hypothetical protein